MQERKNFLLYAFFLINIGFIFLQIHKQSYLVKFFFEKQRLEKEKENLMNKKNHLTQELYIIKNPNNISKFAQDNLNMKKIKLNQIKKIKLNE